VVLTDHLNGRLDDSSNYLILLSDFVVGHALLSFSFLSFKAVDYLNIVSLEDVSSKSAQTFALLCTVRTMVEHGGTHILDIQGRRVTQIFAAEMYMAATKA